MSLFRVLYCGGPCERKVYTAVHSAIPMFSCFPRTYVDDFRRIYFLKFLQWLPVFLAFLTDEQLIFFQLVSRTSAAAVIMCFIFKLNDNLSFSLFKGVHRCATSHHPPLRLFRSICEPRNWIGVHTIIAVFGKLFSISADKQRSAICQQMGGYPL